MGACYKCGGEGWLKRVTILNQEAMQHVSVTNGQKHGLGRQFASAGRSTVCPVCQGRGVPANQSANMQGFIPTNAG